MRVFLFLAKYFQMNSTFKRSALFSVLILFLYVLTGTLSNFGAIDILAPQWIYLNTINILSCIYFIYDNTNFSKSLNLLKYILFFYVALFFLIWNFLSYFYAINPTETIINFPRLLNSLLALFFCYHHFYRINNKVQILTYIMLAFLSAELLAYYNSFSEVYPLEGLRVSRIKGFAGNKNITAASIAFKLPFLLYFFYSTKKYYFKIISSLFLFAGFLAISLIEARAAILSTLIVCLSFITFLILESYYKVSKRKSNIFNISTLFIVFTITYLTNIILTNISNKKNIVDTVGKIAFTKDSSNGRFDYWLDALDYFLVNPFISSGLGNWKIASIAEGIEHISGYTVPYHAHNDFIHVFVETGVLGGLSYILIFLILFYFIVNIIKNKYLENKFFSLKYLFLILPYIVYVIDANLNFPVARPIMQSSFAIYSGAIIAIYAVQTNTLKPLKNIKFVYGRLLNLTLLPLLIFALIIHYISFDSLTKQGLLLYEFNNASYNMSISDLNNISHKLPNLTETAMPIKSMKARYYYLNGKKNEAYKLVREGIKDNPSIFFSENLLSLFHFQDGQIDSSYVYAKKAFDGLPNNMPHYDMMMKSCAALKKYDEIDSTFEKMMKFQYTDDNVKLIWTIYIRSLAQTRGVGDPHALNQAVKAYNLFPNDNNLSMYYRLLTYGQKRVESAISYFQKASALYEEKKFEEAAKYFSIAAELDSIEKTYTFNTGLAYFESKNYEEAIRYFDLTLLSKHFDEIKERAMRYKAVSLYNSGRKGNACAVFLKLKNKYPSRMHSQEFDKFCLGK